MKMRHLLAFGSALGFIGVALGAFGAHGLKATLALEAERPGWWTTATTYLLVHALAVCLAALAKVPKASLAFGLGAVVFSGSLYAMALSGTRWLGAVTPFGGLGMLLGWVILGVTAIRSRDPNGT